MKQTVLELPATWDDITIIDYIKITKIDNTADSRDTIVKILMIFNEDISAEDCNDIPDETLVDAMAQLEWLKSEVPTEMVPQITVGNITYDIKPFDTLSLGQVVSLETLIKQYKPTNYEYLPLILSIVLTEDNVPFNTTDIQDRIKVFSLLPIATTFGILLEFNKWRSNVSVNYSGLFGGHYQRDEDEDSEELSDIQDSGDNFNDKWSWFSIIEKLANGDITKFGEVTETNYIACLNLLSYWKEKEDIQKEIERAKKRNG